MLVCQFILTLENSKWNKIKSKEREKKYLLYLGQAFNEIEEQIGMPLQGSNWKIKGMRIVQKDKTKTRINSKLLPRTFLDLNIPISEPLFELSLPLKSNIEFEKKFPQKVDVIQENKKTLLQSAINSKKT